MLNDRRIDKIIEEAINNYFLIEGGGKRYNPNGKGGNKWNKPTVQKRRFDKNGKLVSPNAKRTQTNGDSNQNNQGVYIQKPSPSDSSQNVVTATTGGNQSDQDIYIPEYEPSIDNSNRNDQEPANDGGQGKTPTNKPQTTTTVDNGQTEIDFNRLSDICNGLNDVYNNMLRSDNLKEVMKENKDYSNFVRSSMAFTAKVIFALRNCIEHKSLNENLATTINSYGIYTPQFANDALNAASKGYNAVKNFSKRVINNYNYYNTMTGKKVLIRLMRGEEYNKLINEYKEYDTHHKLVIKLFSYLAELRTIVDNYIEKRPQTQAPKNRR